VSGIQSEKAQEEVAVFFGFGGPAEILGSVYWKV